MAKIEFDTPMRLPLGHEFVRPLKGEECDFVIKGGIDLILCGKTEKEHVPIKIGGWESFRNWVKGAFS